MYIHGNTQLMDIISDVDCKEAIYDWMEMPNDCTTVTVTHMIRTNQQKFPIFSCFALSLFETQLTQLFLINCVQNDKNHVTYFYVRKFYRRYACLQK